MLAKGALCNVVVGELKLPPVGTVPIELAAHSPTAAEFFGRMKEAMLRGPDEVDWLAERRQVTYEDPVFKKASALLDFARRLWDWGALSFTEECLASVPLFGVLQIYSDDGYRLLRPVWAERKANYLWRDPPVVPLGTPVRFCDVDLSFLTDLDRLCSTTGDVPEFFTRCRTPSICWPFFVLDGVTPVEFQHHMRSVEI